jgi:hypothetical protein
MVAANPGETIGFSYDFEVERGLFLNPGLGRDDAFEAGSDGGGPVFDDTVMGVQVHVIRALVGKVVLGQGSQQAGA